MFWAVLGFRREAPGEVNGNATQLWQVLNETNHFNRLTLLLLLIYIFNTKLSAQCLLNSYQSLEMKSPL